jgi:cyclopropane-fatty-acyl-phospholipid synthase
MSEQVTDELSATGEPTNQHYGQNPRVFAAFLDRTLKYSSGLYSCPGDTLDQAQLRKLEFVADQLGLRGGERVLDVGCGWGSLVLFMADRLGCDVVGVTPAPPQAAYILEQAARRGLNERVRIEIGRFQDLTLDGHFAAVTMLGSIVHIRDRAGAVRACRRMLRRGGRLYISESCFRNHALYREFSMRPATLFVRDEIFGWGDMVPLSVLIEAVEDAGFSVMSLADLTEHYGRTIEDWRRNLAANRAAMQACSPGLADRLDRAFQVANAGWGYTTKHYALTCANAR